MLLAVACLGDAWASSLCADAIHVHHRLLLLPTRVVRFTCGRRCDGPVAVAQPQWLLGLCVGALPGTRTPVTAKGHAGQRWFLARNRCVQSRCPPRVCTAWCAHFIWGKVCAGGAGLFARFGQRPGVCVTVRTHKNNPSRFGLGFLLLDMVIRGIYRLTPMCGVWQLAISSRRFPIVHRTLGTVLSIGLAASCLWFRVCSS